jgi:hypothetical protein
MKAKRPVGVERKALSALRINFGFEGLEIVVVEEEEEVGAFDNSEDVGFSGREEFWGVGVLLFACEGGPGEVEDATVLR